jgi:hypothetical protein
MVSLLFWVIESHPHQRLAGAAVPAIQALIA